MSRLLRAGRACVGTPLNAAITAGLIVLLAWVLPPLFRWGAADATWSAMDRHGCGPDGACWAFIRARWQLFFYGPYPPPERWRVDSAALLLLAALLAALFAGRGRAWALLALLVGVPVAGGVLLAGGLPGLPFVPTAYWGGLLLNVVLCFLAVAASLPLGTLLALGRRSRLPFVRALCTGLVEFWRGVPVLAVLFMGLVLLPMALPPGWSMDTLLRAAAVLVFFLSAYMAEVIRGGLQGVGPGQYEAAAALGLHPVQAHLRVILPQAMRIAVPGIINLVVDLFKDTTLVSIVGLFDLMGVVNQSLKDQAWLGHASEGYVFAALVFFACCLLISLAGSVLERRLSAQGRPSA
ncbi:MAG: amino acid ABC transporter permease [Acetobacteraceae bacterium]|nr:amino acid ABC transporter permease [Acetobacteraceae bacterium]